MLKYFAKKRTQEPQQLLTLEDWFKGIGKIKDPLELTNVLLSDWPFGDKARILGLLPKKAIGNKVGMELLELQLEEFGHFQVAQVLRWILFWNLPRHRIKLGLKWSNRLISIDVEMRQIIQRETYLQEEIKALQKSVALEEEGDKKEKATKKPIKQASKQTTKKPIKQSIKKPTKEAQLNACETHLRGLNKKYWDFHRSSGEVEGDIPNGILRRAFKSCRSDPEWFLCPWLREDCARRGGCCGRNCGCCEMGPSTNRQWSRGHCTRACGCCIRTQGRSGKDAWSEECRKEDFSFDVTLMESPYSGRVNRAYVWNLSILDELDLLGIFE